ncbi:MAG: phage Gp37/Gp68 family protein [Alistipes sp.]|nr:phage Gp37/Gp68 family protein [Alistipes senegalensis]MCM1250865.1 phage Gp37/Gp68 family protein [Alistipes sp.]
MSIAWNPWHGCRKTSEGCRHCYVYRQDAQHDLDSSRARKTAAFDLPVRRRRDGRFKIPAGEMIYTCFTSDFLLEEADAWRPEAWAIMRLRHDLTFMFFTKRIGRLREVLPPDWGEGYDNVVIGCTVENQEMADRRLPIFLETPIRRRVIVCAPLLGALELEPYLTPDIEEVSVGGESGPDARTCDYDWVLGIRKQCMAADIPFLYHQTGARLQKEGRLYRIRRADQHSQARKAGIDYKAERHAEK